MAEEKISIKIVIPIQIAMIVVSLIRFLSNNLFIESDDDN